MTYRKAGTTVRLESARGCRTIIRLVEHGVAEEKGRSFCCASSQEGAEAIEVSAGVATAIERSILPLSSPVERMTIVVGTARHSFESRRWEESQVRVHLSLTHGSSRVTLDLGGGTWTDAHDACVQKTAAALGRVRGKSSPGPVLLNAPVSARLWPEILMSALESSSGVPFVLAQSRHPAFRYDGYGIEIDNFALCDRSTVASPDRWPNVYRPTYRSRPASAAFHLRAELPAADELPRREALAILGAPSVQNGRIRAEVLCDDGSSAIIDTDAGMLRSAGGEPEWFPYGAGSWGIPVVVP